MNDGSFSYRSGRLVTARGDEEQAGRKSHFGSEWGVITALSTPMSVTSGTMGTMVTLKVRVLAALSATTLLFAAGCAASDDAANPDDTTTESQHTIPEPPADPGDDGATSDEGADNEPADTPDAEPDPTADEPAPDPSNDPEPDDGAANDGRCTFDDIELSLGEPNGAMGSVYVPLTFTNVGDADCSLAGFPGVSYVTGGDGTQLGAPAAWEGDDAGEVVLAPGDDTTISVREVNVGVFDEEDCHPAEADGLRVYLPGEDRALFVEQEWAQGCMADPLPDDHQQLTVTAFGVDI